jgi:NADH:ubiquinone oxidoreductase subunit K
MMNAILSILALASFAFYLGIIAWFVRQPDLIILLAFGLVLAAVDFLRSFLSSRQNGG